MLVTKEIYIDTSHRVPNHKSKCKTPHGHCYRIEVGVDDKKIQNAGASDEGMVIDFSDLKEVMMEVIDKPYDHSGVYWENDPKRDIVVAFHEGEPKDPVFVSFIPTAENLAQWWFVLLKPELEKRGVTINHVKVWETKTSTAIYTK